MKNLGSLPNRRRLLLAALAAGSLIAACSSDILTGPSSRELAHLFDSASTADVVPGNPGAVRPQLEAILAFAANEGLTPTTVQLTTDGGTLSMQMMAVVFYDTTVFGIDSAAYIVGWTRDYVKYVSLAYRVAPGVGVENAGRHLVPFSSLTPLSSLRGREHHGTRAEASFADLSESAFVVDGDSAVAADSMSGDIAWSTSRGQCALQHAIDGEFAPDTVETCTPVTVTVDFVYHFPAQAGIDPSLTHIRMPTEAIPGVEVGKFDLATRRVL